MTQHCRLFILSAIFLARLFHLPVQYWRSNPTIEITCRHKAAPDNTDSTGNMGKVAKMSMDNMERLRTTRPDPLLPLLATVTRKLKSRLAAAQIQATVQIRDMAGTQTRLRPKSRVWRERKPWLWRHMPATLKLSRRARPGAGPPPQPNTYSSNEIVDAGHRFFGKASEGLANVVEYAFRKNGRPNGYILGEEASGAFVGGLRYGEGVLHTKGFGTQKIYWQGPSLGYDFGANGSKTLTLVYNLQYPSQIYERFAGVEGSAYFVGGVGITFQQHDDVILAPIRAGVGLRLGANVGYLKYTSSPTWNPF